MERTANKDPVGFGYKLEGAVLNEVDYFGYLGVSITNTFDWGKHIDLKWSEALRTLGLLRRTITTAPEKLKLQAYKTFSFRVRIRS